MRHVTFLYLLGMGGYALDPGGAIVIRQKVNALKGTWCPPLFQYTDCGSVAQMIKNEIAEDEAVVISGDSCGANRLQWVAEAAHPRKIDLLYAINASIWCATGCPPVPDNVVEVYDIYGGAVTLGLSQYRVPLVQMPQLEQDGTYHDGKAYHGNGGKTKVTWQYINAPHPDDNDPWVQDLLVKKIQGIINS